MMYELSAALIVLPVAFGLIIRADGICLEGVSN
jgi:hypothetical protein